MGSEMCIRDRYSTCTFAPCEDEQTVAWTLEQFPQMRLIPLPEYEGFSPGRPEWGNENSAGYPEGTNGNLELKRCVRIWPHKMNGEGHFLALLEKDSAGRSVSGEQEESRAEQEKLMGILEEKNPKGLQRETKRNGRLDQRKKAGKKGKASGSVSENALSRKDRELIEEFLKPCSRSFPAERMELRGQKVYLVPELPETVRGLKFLRNGLYMGEIRKDRFEPSQQLAMSLGAGEFQECICLEPDDERAQRYLRGETLNIRPEETKSPSGWKLVCVGGLPLGWGKLVQGVLKNKYQSSWRKN